MYEDQTESTIRQRMLDAVPSDLNKREGSFIYDGISPAAIELALAYIELDRVINLGFIQTTYGQYLDYRAAEHGLTRKAATKATGQVTILGSQGTVVPVGSVFATGSGVEFETTDEVTIDETGQVSADIEAVDAGTGGNVPAETITEILVSIQGVTDVINNDPTEGGTDEETDDALVSRLLEKVRLPATSGNVAHYKQWALEVAGVGDAKVFPTWDGPLTVKVAVIDSNKQPASAEIVQDVAGYIEEVRPIGATVTVESAAGLNIDVSATVVLDTGAVLADVQAAFESALDEYLQEIAFEQNYVSYAQIGALLLNTSGVLDYSNLLLNGASANVSVGDTASNCRVAIRGTVSLSE
jgi:uncharacterized phage protein gp47/JayE